jgi:diaminopimelate decarboxylase
MDYFTYKNQQLCAEEVPVADIAEQYGTPVYIYSQATLERHWHAFDDGLGDYPHLICYAVKANSNLAVLQVMARLGSGFDIVSVGELERVLAAGGEASKVVFSGVGKLPHEIERALDAGIMSFNVESSQELERIASIAANKNCVAPISIRVNPDVDAKTHPYIATGLKDNKFGVSRDEALSLYEFAAQSPHLDVLGVDCHIGSQLTSMQPFLDALDRVLSLVQQLKERGITLKHLNLGGGIGVPYTNETPPHPSEYSQAVKKRLEGQDISLILEPGRAIAANAGILVTRVEYLKTHHDKHFAVVDAAMNDILRPAIYSAIHNIIPVQAQSPAEKKIYDVVGPVCETGDFLGKDRSLALQTKDLLAVRTAGAYCFSMSSNYNSRTRAAEVLVDGMQVHLVRERETIANLFSHEHLVTKI